MKQLWWLLDDDDDDEHTVEFLLYIDLIKVTYWFSDTPHDDVL